MTRLRLGCCWFSYVDWRGPFYPPGIRPDETLSLYAEAFSAVEVDSTFYGPPSEATIAAWASRVPPHFRFALKVPQVVTHEKMLIGAEADFDAFVSVTEGLGALRGPLLLQFPRFSRSEIGDPAEFRGRLAGFLSGVDKDLRLAVEIRNPGWIDDDLLDILRDSGVALAVTDQVVRPDPTRAARYVTSDFAYVRLLGERARIEAITKRWDAVVIDRAQELAAWAAFATSLCQALPDGPVWVFANNHFAGHAPASVRAFAAGTMA